MVRIRNLLLVYAVGCLPVVATAQDGHVLTVEECVAYGLEKNHRLRAMRFVADEARASSDEARGRLLPGVRVDANYTHLSPNVPDFELTLPAEFSFPGADDIFAVPAIRDRYDVSVRVEQPVFSGLRLLGQRRAAGLSADAREFDAEAAAVEVAYAVRMAYWNLYEAFAAQDVAEASLQQIEAQVAVVTRRREAGAALPSDLLAMQTRAADVRLDLLEAENAVSIARLRLNEAAGLPVDKIVEPVEPPPIDWSSPAAEALEARALAESPEIEAAGRDVDAAQALSRAAGAGWFPEVFLVGVYQYARPNPYIFPQEDAFTGTWQVGLGARWQLWDWGQTRARHRQAQARARRMAEARVETERSVQFGVREKVLAVEHGRLAASVAAQGMRDAEAAYAAERRRYELGAALTAELLAAEVASRTAALRHARARAAFEIAVAALARELGSVDTTLAGIDTGSR